MTFEDYKNSHSLQATYEDIQEIARQLGSIIDFMEQATSTEFEVGYIILNYFLQDAANALAENDLPYAYLEELEDEYRAKILNLCNALYFDKFKGDNNRIMQGIQAALNIPNFSKEFNKNAIMNVLTKSSVLDATYAGTGETAGEDANEADDKAKVDIQKLRS